MRWNVILSNSTSNNEMEGNRSSLDGSDDNLNFNDE